MLKVFKKIHLPWVDQVSEPFAFSNGFFFKLHKNTAVLSLSQIERGWYFQKMIFLSLCLISEGRNIGLKSGQKCEIQGLFWHFFLAVLWGPRSVTSRNFASSRVEWAGGERLGTRLPFKQKISTLAHYFQIPNRCLSTGWNNVYWHVFSLTWMMWSANDMALCRSTAARNGLPDNSKVAEPKMEKQASKQRSLQTQHPSNVCRYGSCGLKISAPEP